MLSQRPWKNVDQLGQHVEAALAGFHALLLQLLVERFDDHGDLRRRRRRRINALTCFQISLQQHRMTLNQTTAQDESLDFITNAAEKNTRSTKTTRERGQEPF